MTTNVTSPDQLAEKLGVERETVMDWRRLYNWPCVRIGRRIWFLDEHVEAILARHSVKPAKKAAAAPAKIPGQTGRSAARRS